MTLTIFFTRTDSLTLFSAIILFSTFIFISEYLEPSDISVLLAEVSSGWTIVLIYKRLAVTKDARPKWTMDLSLPLRIITFGLYIIIAMRLVTPRISTVCIQQTILA